MPGCNAIGHGSSQEAVSDGTGLRVALASIQGGYLDKRELQASLPDEVHREVGPDGSSTVHRAPARSDL